MALGLGLAAWWWRRRPFRVAVEGTSMAPTLVPGDLLVAVRTDPSRLRRGDLVVVEHPLRPEVEMVKRLTALPGDEVGHGGGHVLGPDEFWIAGDDAAASTDSRRFGPIAGRRVLGVIRLRYWPPGRLAWLQGRPRETKDPGGRWCRTGTGRG